MSNLTQSENRLQIYLESYTPKEGELVLYLNSSQGAAWKPQQEDFSVSLGRETLQVTGSSTVAEEEVPVTILFLVDVSGSLDNRRMEDIKTVISGITGQLREQDRVCIIAMGDELRSSGFLTDKEEIQAQTDALAVLKEDTNLYQGIEQSLQALQSDETAGAKKCLVVLSDGAEDNNYGITREEVNKAIQDSRIPVYTVGMPKNAENASQLDSVKVLGSFSRISAGGVHYVPAIDKTDFVTVADDIWSNIMSGQIVTVDVSEYVPAGREVYLQVSVEAEGSEPVQTGITVVDSHMIAEVEKTEEQGDAGTEEAGETGETGEAETLQEGTEANVTEAGKSNVPLFVGIGVLAVILIGLLFLLLRRKKKNKKQPEEEIMDFGGETPQAVGRTEDVGATSGIVEGVGTAGNTEGFGTEGYAAQGYATEGYATGEYATGGYGTEGYAAGFGGTQALAGSGAGNEAAAYGMRQQHTAGLPVQLIRMGIGETLTYSLTIADRMSMGRDSQAADFALAEDRGLSSLHCIFRYEEGKLFLEDAGSTNGTYVNGVPIKGSMRLNRDDVLLIGSYEYRIYW